MDLSTIRFDRSALIAGHINFGDGLYKFEKIQMQYPVYFPDTTETLIALTERDFRVGQRRHMVFAVPITEVGGYFLQFHAAYWRIPFDDETPSTASPRAIHALEQMIYQATGQPTTDPPSE